MGIGRYFALFKDLLKVLPQRNKSSWAIPSSAESDRPLVILVSGLGATHRALSVLQKRLIRDGYRAEVFSLDWDQLAKGEKGITYLAEHLAHLVRTARSATSMPAALVAHSAGGLVARYYVQFLGGEKDCNVLITLATPHSGTWYAVLGFVTTLIRRSNFLFSMLPISRFIRKINEAPLPRGFRLIDVYSKDDLLGGTKHYSHAQQTIELKGFSHRDFLFRKETYEVVRNVLREVHGAVTKRKIA